VRHFEPLHVYEEAPQGEVKFDLGVDHYWRELRRCGLCRHVVSVHTMDMSELYAGEYVDATYGADGMRRSFERIVGLPAGQSDNVGRAARIVDFAGGHLANAATAPRLLDVGSGLAVFPHRMRAHGWDCVALDPDPRAVQHARDVAGVDAVCGDFLTFDLAHLGKFDCVTFNKVLEHVIDPVAMLARARALLSTEGFVYIELPDAEAAWGDGAEREEFFIDHHHVFSPPSMALLAERAGFRIAVLERLREPSGKFTLRAFVKPALSA
jgi:SAM-dependent methyltransferase